MPEYVQGASPVLLLEWWKPVVGYEGLYEVSNVGNVCRIKKSNVSRPGQHLRKWAHWDGRLFVVLSKQGRSQTKKVHKIMVDAFLGGTPEGLTVHHEDDNFTNNRISNFRFLSAIDNWRDGYLSGLMAHGQNHKNAKLTEAQAMEILSLNGKMSLNRVSKKYGVSTTAVSYIWKGRNWSHLQAMSSVLPGRKPVPKGNELPQALLTPDIVRQIRIQKGKSGAKVLASKYGVSCSTIYKVWSGKQWSHVE